MLGLDCNMNEREIIRLVSDGFEKAKGGDATNVYEKVAGLHDSGQLPDKSHYPFGWIIYYALHQSKQNEVAKRKRMLARYLKLNVEKPHKLHSMILTEALSLYKDSQDAIFSQKTRGVDVAKREETRFSLVAFCDLWNLGNLRPGDWRRKDYEGNTLPSTVEKLITNYVDELSSTNKIPTPEFMEIVERALEEYPDSSNLSAQCAQLCVISGDTERAVVLLRNAILSAPTKFFLWSRLAELMNGEESRRLKIAFLYKALCCPGQEDFKGRIHLMLADALAEAGAYPEAMWEMTRVKEIYGRNGWHLPPRFKEIEKRMPVSTSPVDPAAAYRKVEKMADDFIYDGLPEIPVKKTYHKSATETANRFGGRNTPLAAWRVTDGKGNNYWFNPGKFGVNEALPNNTSLLVKVHAGKIVKARLSEV